MRGWGEVDGLVEFMRGFSSVVASAEDAYPFIAEIESVPVASGLLTMHAGVALLGGASTVPAARGRGAQRALLAARLQFAADHGCSGDDVCRAGKRLPAQCRAARLPDRVHADQVAEATLKRSPAMIRMATVDDARQLPGYTGPMSTER